MTPKPPTADAPAEASASVAVDSVAAAWARAAVACRTADVEICAVTSADGGRELVGLLNRIWGATERDLMDAAFLIALVHSQNPAFEARRGAERIGAAVGFCGPPGEPFHSHIVGVLPEATGRGVGRAMKAYQRAWCLARGITTMSWTFDPLVARNAFFNIRRLGALPVAYHPDFYGTMTDGINAGQPSDRIVVVWDLTADLPPSGRPEPDPGPAATVVVDHTAGRPGDHHPPSAAATGSALIGLPSDIEAIRRHDPELARQWRSVTRQAFTDLFARGWTVSGFTGAGQYLLRPPTRQVG